jgi:hypothetical protein
MNEQIFKFLCIGFALLFSACFFILITPPFLENPDIVSAFAAGFVNPYSSGYALDAIVCGLILFTWIIYEAKNLGIKHGWICLVLSVAPGVAVGFGLYLVIRHPQIKKLMK